MISVKKLCNVFLALILSLALGCSRNPPAGLKAPKPAAEPIPTPVSFAKGMVAWEGYYELESPLCSDTETWGPCNKEFKDCIFVKNATNGWRVELYSIQAMQNICAFSLRMNQVGEKLIYYDENGGEITLQKQEGKLILSSLGIDPRKAGFCGAHAGIDGISFPLSTKKYVGKRCFDENQSETVP